MKKRIAVIEDNPDSLMLIEALLEDEFAVAIFEDGHAGLAGMRAARPDVVLLDISLPGKDGIAILGEIRFDAALQRRTVIALTAHAMQGDRERFLAAGFDDSLSKPIVDEGAQFRMIRSHSERGCIA